MKRRRLKRKGHDKRTGTLPDLYGPKTGKKNGDITALIGHKRKIKLRKSPREGDSGRNKKFPHLAEGGS